MKKEIRIIAWDDCSFSFKQKYVTVLGVVFRGASFLDGLLSAKITKDGVDGTERISSAIVNSRHYDQLSYIMFGGITMAGFNLVDVKSVHKTTGLPVVVVLRKKPDMEKFLAALKKFTDCKRRVSAVKSAGRFYPFKNLVYQKAGIGNKECEELLKITCVRSIVPEPLRVAHLIASGLSGESHGRA